MYSKIKIWGQPLHPMLVAFPISCYFASFLSFVVAIWNPEDLFWLRLGVLASAAGVVTAVFAAIPGALDWAMGIPKNAQAKKTGALHGLLNVGALILFAVNWGLWTTSDFSVEQLITPALILTGLGVMLTLAAGYYGWEMVARHKVGVELTPEQERIERREEGAHPTPPFQPHRAS